MNEDPAGPKSIPTSWYPIKIKDYRPFPASNLDQQYLLLDFDQDCFDIIEGFV